MIYHNPNTVLSPKDFVDNVSVIFDGGANSYSIAEVIWEGQKQLAIRWNIARREWDDQNKINNQTTCVGMPSSHGYPVWFIIPAELIDCNSEINKTIKDYLNK